MEVYKLSLLVITKELDASSSRIRNEDLFCTTNIIVDTLRDLVGRKLYTYCWYFIDGDSWNCALTWWRTKDHRFPTITTLLRLIGHVGLPNWSKKDFFHCRNHNYISQMSHFKHKILINIFLLKKIGHMIHMLGALNFLTLHLYVKHIQIWLRSLGLNVEFTNEV